MFEAYYKFLNETVEILQESPIGYFNKVEYEYFFSENNIPVRENIQTFFPDIRGENIAHHIIDTVRKYHQKNWLGKIWWHMTKSMDAYLMLNDILAMHTLSECKSYKQAIACYKYFNLKPAIGVMDWAFSSWRYKLDEMMNDITDRYNESLYNLGLTFKTLVGKNIQSTNNKLAHDFKQNGFTQHIDIQQKNLRSEHVKIKSDMKSLDDQFRVRVVIEEKHVEPLILFIEKLGHQSRKNKYVNRESTSLNSDYSGKRNSL